MLNRLAGLFAFLYFKMMSIRRFERFLKTHLSLVYFLLFSFLSISATGDEDVDLYKCPDIRVLPSEVTIPKNLVSGGSDKDLVFGVNNKKLPCPTKWISETISKTNTSTKIILFTPTGVLFLHSEYFYPDEYCISRITETTLEISYCEVNCEVTHICIQKCCGLGKVYDISERTCVPSGEIQWSPTIYSKDNYKGCGQKVDHLKEHFHYTKMVCPEDSVLDWYTYKSIPGLDLEGIRFRLLEDGKIVVNTEQRVWKHQKYLCMDGLVDNSSISFTGNQKDELFSACVAAGNEEEISSSDLYLRTRTIVYTVVICLGIFFLILTAIVYLLLWKNHNIHGWIIFSFVISMLFFFTVLAASHIMAEILDSQDYGSTRCTFIAILVHFLFLCTMCWLSVINVDLWLTFRSLAPSTGRTKMIQRYCMYASFALGLPFLILILGIILDSVYKGLPLEDLECGVSFVSPRYGQESCRVHPSSQGLYLYLPMGILLGSNILMFSSTVFTLMRYRKTARNAVNNSSQPGNQKQSLILFCKLFVVMGITWVMEIISFSLSDNNSTNDWYIWICFDIINLLQAVAVFFIFACKRENLVAIYRKYPRGKKLLEPIMRWGPCRVGSMDVEQTEMTSADRHRIDRNTKVNFTNTRMSNISQDDF